MLSYEKTVEAIYALEESIKRAEGDDVHTKEYVEHNKRLLAAMIKEHRRAAARENEYAIR